MGPRVLKDDASSQFLPKSCGTRPLQGGQGWTRTVAGAGGQSGFSWKRRGHREGRGTGWVVRAQVLL